jgi:hypothetical protein
MSASPDVWDKGAASQLYHSFDLVAGRAKIAFNASTKCHWQIADTS